MKTNDNYMYASFTTMKLSQFYEHNSRQNYKMIKIQIKDN